MTGRADPDGRPRHGHTNHSTLVGARAAAVSAHNMCHSYMRQVVDTTSLRPGPPAPPQCREWRRSLVSLSHEPPTSDLHASQAAIHTHAPQPTWFGAMSANAPATRPARRDQLTHATPHMRRAQTDMVRSRDRLEPSHRASNDAFHGVAARTPLPSRAAIHPRVRCLLRLGKRSEARAEG